jgi:hypothetical protein
MQAARGLSVEDRAALAACRELDELVDLADRFEIESKPLPPDLAMLKQRAVVVAFRLTTSVTNSVDALPQPLLELLNNTGVTWIGVNHKADFTNINKKWPGVDRPPNERMVPLNLGTAFPPADECNTASLKQLCEILCQWDIWKPDSLKDFDWSQGSLPSQWIEYAQMDAWLPLMIYYNRQGALGVDACGVVETARDLVFPVVTAPRAKGDEPAFGNRGKEDWSHTHRAFVGYVNKEHPMRSTFAFLLARCHLVQYLNSIRKENARMMASGMSEAAVKNFNHSSKTGRVEQYCPPPDELLTRFDELMEFYDDVTDFETPGKKKIPWFTTEKSEEKFRKLVEKHRNDIKMDRYSDPRELEGNMYTERSDGTLISKRGSNKQEAKHE